MTSASGPGLDSELESFRRQWLSEVRTKQGSEPVSPGKPDAQPKPPSRAPSPTNLRNAAPVPSAEEDESSCPHGPFDDASTAAAAGPSGTTVDGSVRTPPGRELVSALDHYEEAMAKEAEGNMGDSLKLYRRAYRLDNRVDRRYREKHFPASHKPPTHAPAQHSTVPPAASPEPSASAQTTTSPRPDAGAKPDSAAAPAVVLPIKDLIASFSDLRIQPAPPPVQDTPPAPCPISALPRELLVHILHEVALHDVGDFVRLSLVCKPLAYLVPTQQHTWRQVCLGTRFGFPGMHYHWHKTTDWLDPSSDDDDDDDASLLTSSQLLAQRRNHAVALSRALVRTGLYPSWKHMLQHRPRIRFNGCYISTVNYIRMGQASTNQATWGGSPVHIVTYYRYLRFFRDGTAISLLTTSEPAAVVPHLTREALLSHLGLADSAAAAGTYVPPAVMQKAYRARWRLSPPSVPADDGDTAVPSGPRRPQTEGDLTVETETHDPKYMFRMDLSLRTAGRATRNNKLVWQGHFSYNKLTDDWAEFTLKHDRAFFFSRVKSYGMGGQVDYL
ncbi:hypothetical protein E4U42_007802 [Claviceps africana]|uniref:F-box domain-containing protein n=1 Tax=Claviceps africana TaxID=83212 RepID=A0A8K0J0K0_9HYPO|nr:hypothetical protein E4U42_007802 [Claviceps africana]